MLAREENQRGVDLRREARALAQAAGHRGLVSRLDSDLGGALTVAGDYRGAEVALLRSLEESEALGRSTLYPLANLGIALVDLGRPAEARPLLTRALGIAELEGRKFLPGGLHVDLARCAALEGNGAEFDRLVDRAARLLPQDFCYEVSFARHLAACGDQAADAGQPESARRAWGLAAVQLRLHGATDEADVWASKVAALG